MSKRPGGPETTLEADAAAAAARELRAMRGADALLRAGVAADDVAMLQETNALQSRAVASLGLGSGQEARFGDGVLARAQGTMRGGGGFRTPSGVRGSTRRGNGSPDSLDSESIEGVRTELPSPASVDSLHDVGTAKIRASHDGVAPSAGTGASGSRRPRDRRRGRGAASDSESKLSSPPFRRFARWEAAEQARQQVGLLEAGEVPRERRRA